MDRATMAALGFAKIDDAKGREGQGRRWCDCNDVACLRAARSLLLCSELKKYKVWWKGFHRGTSSSIVHPLP